MKRLTTNFRTYKINMYILHFFLLKVEELKLYIEMLKQCISRHVKNMTKDHSKGR